MEKRIREVNVGSGFRSVSTPIIDKGDRLWKVSLKDIRIQVEGSQYIRVSCVLTEYFKESGLPTGVKKPWVYTKKDTPRIEEYEVEFVQDTDDQGNLLTFVNELGEEVPLMVEREIQGSTVVVKEPSDTVSRYDELVGPLFKYGILKEVENRFGYRDSYIDQFELSQQPSSQQKRSVNTLNKPLKPTSKPLELNGKSGVDKSLEDYKKDFEINRNSKFPYEFIPVFILFGYLLLNSLYDLIIYGAKWYFILRLCISLVGLSTSILILINRKKIKLWI